MRVRRYSAIAASLMVLAIGAACVDSMAPANRENQSQPSTVEVASVFMQGGEVRGLRVTATVDATRATSNGAPELHAVRHSEIPDAERLDMGDKLRSRWNGPSVDRNTHRALPQSAVRDSLLHTKEVRFPDENGNHTRLVTVSMRIPGRLAKRPVSSFLFRNDSAVATMSFVEDHSGRALEITQFAADGTPSSYTSIRAAAADVAAATQIFSRFVELLSNAGTEIGSLIEPAPVFAQEEECIDYEMEMAFAFSAYMLAEIAAIGACPSTGPGCAIAIAALGVAAAYLVWTTTQYEDCLYNYYNPSPPPSGGTQMRAGDGSQATDEECYYIEWEISYDGGQTWQFHSIQIIC